MNLDLNKVNEIIDKHIKSIQNSWTYGKLEAYEKNELDDLMELEKKQLVKMSVLFIGDYEEVLEEEFSDYCDDNIGEIHSHFIRALGYRTIYDPLKWRDSRCLAKRIEEAKYLLDRLDDVLYDIELTGLTDKEK